MIKLITIDIDGTLVTPMKRITKNTEKIIKKASENGLYIALASGRPFSGMKSYIDKLSLNKENSFSVTQNGAYIHRNSNGDVVAKNCLRTTDLKFVEKFLKKFKLQMGFMDEKFFYTNEKLPNIFLIGDSFIAKRKLRRVNFKNFNEDKEFGRILVMGNNRNITNFSNNLPKELSEKYYCVRTERYLFEIIAKKTNKGKGVYDLSNMLNVKKNEIMSIGNELNDIPMFEESGLSIAMGNSSEYVKNFADFVTLSNKKDGVYFVIDKLLKNKCENFTKNSKI